VFKENVKHREQGCIEQLRHVHMGTIFPMTIAPCIPVRSETLPFKVADTHLRLPNPALTSCIRAYVSRNTSGIALAPHEMFNNFAASPLCTIMWTIKGDGELVSIGGLPVTQATNEKIYVAGPHTLPSVTKNVGEMHGLMVFFMPDAFHALTGIDVASLVNTFMPIAKLLDASWQRMADDVFMATDDTTRIQILETFLLARWEACRDQLPKPVSRHHDWVINLATRAALSGVGKSTRQLERRVKRWSGQSLQRLRGIARTETAFFEVRDALENKMLSWAEVAFNTGFSDQAHMCREVRRITGYSPEEFKQAMATEESFWLYRLWM
jgi:AraC-like DNA-binding protein